MLKFTSPMIAAAIGADRGFVGSKATRNRGSEPGSEIGLFSNRAEPGPSSMYAFSKTLRISP
jgi:hypothetical protein